MVKTIFTKQDIKELETKGQKILIHCPHCKAQDLPGEIYIPGALIGQPVEIVKDSLGEILYVDYHTESNLPNNKESFTCEYCDKPFVLDALITYKPVHEAPERDFRQQYVSLID